MTKTLAGSERPRPSARLASISCCSGPDGTEGRVLTPARRNRIADAAEIRDVVESWVIWRDAGDWERFATVWHSDARMMATWFQGSAQDFISVSRAGWERGVSILHFLGGMSIDVAMDRAVAQTKMTISQR